MKETTTPTGAGETAAQMPDKIRNWDGSEGPNSALLTVEEITKISATHPGCLINGDEVRDSKGARIGKVAGVLFEIERVAK
jgi:hypothetical protein